MDLLTASMDETEREANGFLTGVALGIVTDNNDPDGLARVRVRLPWHPDGDTSFWARIAVPMAGGTFRPCSLVPPRSFAQHRRGIHNT